MGWGGNLGSIAHVAIGGLQGGYRGSHSVLYRGVPYLHICSRVSYVAVFPTYGSVPCSGLPYVVVRSSDPECSVQGLTRCPVDFVFAQTVSIEATDAKPISLHRVP